VVTVIVVSPEAQQSVYPVVQIIDLATGNLPTAAQLSGWVAATELGVSLDQMATAFVASSAFADTYNNGTAIDPNAPITASIVGAIIQNATGVAATAAQVSAWVSSGETVDQVFVDFALGDQYTAASQSAIEQYLTAAADNAAGLSATSASEIVGALTLGTAQTPLSGNDLMILGGAGALTVLASGSGDNITELSTSAATGSIVASGNGDIINAAGGANTISANETGDTINLGMVATGASTTGFQTIHAAGMGDVITFATTAADGTAVTWAGASTVDGGNNSIGIGANSTVSFGTYASGGKETATVIGDLAGETTADGTSTTGIAAITLDNVHDAARDQIVFDNATTEVLAGKVDVSLATTLAHALDMAAADAAASQNGGEIAAHAGVIDWFQYDILEAVNGTGSPGTHSALEATDALVEVTGSASLREESLAGHTLTL
jgi:hypothetical protein